MADTAYDTPSAATGCDVVTRVEAPVVASSPRGLLSVVNMVDEAEPVRWGVTGALYDSFTSFATADTTKGIVLMDCDDFCPSPTAGDASSLTHGRATAYTAWTRIDCTGPQSDALAFANAQFAAREERLLESILADIASNTTPASLGTGMGAGLAALEASFGQVWAGQGTVWVDLPSLYKLGDAGCLMESGSALYTLAGNRVSVSPIYTIDAVMTPNLVVHRASLDVLDFFDRSTNLHDALAQRQYLFVTDPLTDVVSGNFS